MKVLLLLALIGAAYAAVPRIGRMGPNRVIGGEDTTVDKYPFITSMQLNSIGSTWVQSCGGSLITTAMVLSAAHCYDDYRPDEWRASVGSSFPLSGGTTVYLRQLIIHAEFNINTFDNDIALVHLINPVTLSNTVGLARIPAPNYNLPDGTPLTIIGYGRLYYGGPKPSQLQHVEVNIINQELCDERYTFLHNVPGYQHFPLLTQNMVCSGILNVGYKDSCQGDSGGPVTHDGNVIYGITSWGYGCGDPWYPGVSTRVNQYTNWILDNTS